MDESPRQHYRDEILRVLREKGPMRLGTLQRHVKPPPWSRASSAPEEMVREARRELEAEGVLRVRKDPSQRNNPRIVEEVLTGPRQVRGVRLVVDAVGLPAGAVTVEVRCSPVPATRLAELVAHAFEQLAIEHHVALNLERAAQRSPRH